MDSNRPLGRRAPTDWEHVDKYRLRGAPVPPPAGVVPMVLGINWYENFDRPVRDSKSGQYWIGLGNWGRIRGGHAICARPIRIIDNTDWWKFYDQGDEGACVGFSVSRMMTLMKRIRFDGEWLYNQAQLVDEWDDTPPQEGTSVRAGFDVLRKKGPLIVRSGRSQSQPTFSFRISANRWAVTADEVLRTLGYSKMGAIPLLNSWGKNYPHIVWLPAEGVSRLLDEDGEAAVPVMA